MVAFVVAATPFTLAGLPAACWALIAALAASLATEDAELRRHWRGQEQGATNVDVHRSDQRGGVRRAAGHDQEPGHGAADRVTARGVDEPRVPRWGADRTGPGPVARDWSPTAADRSAA
jgi:hypothetical protein